MANIRKQSQNVHDKREEFSLQVFIVGAILSITFFLLFIDAFKTYTSSIAILVNAKSEIAAGKQEQIIGSIIEFPRTLSFYDRLLKYNKDVRDIAAGKSSDKRKDVWNDMFSIERVSGNSSVIKISVTTIRESDSDILVQKTARTLLDVTAAYYDIKNDVDLRIIDGPISHSNLSGWYWTLPLSIALGFSISFFMQYVLSKGKETFVGKKNVLKEKLKISEKNINSLEDLYATEQAEAPFVIQEKTSAAKTQEIKKMTKMIEPDRYPNFREVPKAGQPRVDEWSSPRVEAGAPDNLPIADESFLTQTEPEITNQEVVEKQIDIIPIEEKKPEIHPEPTAEQLKERLNKLLKGEL